MDVPFLGGMYLTDTRSHSARFANLRECLSVRMWDDRVAISHKALLVRDRRTPAILPGFDAVAPETQTAYLTCPCRTDTLSLPYVC